MYVYIYNPLAYGRRDTNSLFVHVMSTTLAARLEERTDAL